MKAGSGTRLRATLRQGWAWLRQLTGDDAYERYCMHGTTHHPHIPLMSRRAFYLAEQQRRWSGINRCC